jgi:hypothetical protein
MKLKERIIDYLRKTNRDINRNDLIAVAEKAGYKRDMVYEILKEIADTTANIGQWQDSKTRVTYIRWYQPNELTNKVQECLDRGDDW